LLQLNDGRPSCSGLRGRRRIYHTILKLADHALFLNGKVVCQF
jgi:hypothetical protein